MARHNLETVWRAVTNTTTRSTQRAQTSAERQFFPDPDPDRDLERTPGSGG